MIRVRVAGPIVAVALGAILTQACATTNQGSATPSNGGPAQSSIASEAASTGVAASTGPVASASGGAAGTTTPAALTMKSIPTKRWGDPAFTASVKGPQGAPVAFSASGGCKVDPKSGKVTIQSVGSCTVTATAGSGGSSLVASAKFKIEPGKPVIKFGARETRFRSALHLDLNASVSPKIKLAYKVIRGASGTANDQYCAVTSDGFLVWTQQPTVDEHPALDAYCMVRVSAAGSSDNWVTPKSVQGLVHIGYPSWKVNAPDQTLTAKQDVEGWYVIVTVNEDNGSALGIDIFGDCGSGSTEGQAIKAGTKTYKVRVNVNDPNGGTYSCNLHASALPQDYHQGNAGTSDTDFKLTVTS